MICYRIITTAIKAALEAIMSKLESIVLAICDTHGEFYALLELN
jgi:hypothetical protein